MANKNTKKVIAKKSWWKPRGRPKKNNVAAKQPKKLLQPKLPSVKVIEDFSHVINEVKDKVKTPNLLSFPYWSSGLTLFSILLLITKAIFLSYYWFVDVGWLRNIVARYIWRLGNDLLYCMLVWFLGQIAMRMTNIPMKSMCVILMSWLLYIYGADMFALMNFHSRFIISWIWFFSRENAWPYLSYGIMATLIWLAWLYWSVVVTYYLAKYLPKRFAFHTLRIGVIIAVLLLIVSFFIQQKSSYQQNILQIEFGNDTREKKITDKSYEEYYKPFSWKNNKPNIIVVFAESFSSIDSLYAGWSKNLLSWFDTIARDGTFYTNFISNWCTSDSSHIALLQWVEPRETPNTQQEYTRYKSYTLWLPAFLSRQWYHSSFISTVTLSFLQQKDFLTALQFDTIVGDEAFKKSKKYVFRAAPDEELYKKAEKMLLEKKSHPQFMVLQTISSHKPYNTPRWTTEEQAMWYADSELLKFYRSLQSMNYFENGILIVVWDHRKMQAMWYNEIERRGKAAYGKSVAAVVGKNISRWKIDPLPLQHWDIFFSLKRLTASWAVSLHEYYNDMFWWYLWRDAWIRYCQFVDRQYVASRADNTSWILSPKQRNHYASYIRAYYEFQQGREYTEQLSWSSSWEKIAVTYPWLIRIAHQGVFDKAPPNSYDAFKAAKQQWVEWIEMDISFTKDWYPIVMHWPDIWRVKCTRSWGKKLVRDFSLQDMKDNCLLYNWQVILTLQEMLSKTQWMFDWYFIDVKIHKPEERQYITAMVRSIQKLWLDEKIMFSSTDDEANYFMWAMRWISAGWEIFSVNDIDKVLDSNLAFVLLPENIITEEVISKIVSAKKIPVAYTVNKATWLSQLYDWWVRYFITDKPSEIIK
jgi:glycerophosphoryl diester phosphodiesterase